MATELREFLAGLATDPKRLAEFMSDADAVMEKAELAEDDRNLLKSGNLAGIQARLAGAVPAQIVVVIGLEQLQRLYTDAMRAMAAPAGALPGAALWQQAAAGALPGAALWQQAPAGALPGAALWQQPAAGALPGAALWQQAPAGAVPGAVLWQQAVPGALPGAVLWQQMPAGALPGAVVWQQAPPGAVAYHVAWLVSPVLLGWR
jgi:hypothetical protein